MYTLSDEIFSRKGVGMENLNILGGHQLLSDLSGLLHKVLNHHDVDGLAQIILHEIGHDNAFGLKRATYLVDNPDFNHLLGVAGYCSNECHHHKKDLWENPYSFTKDMQEAEYHNNVRTFLQDSLKRNDVNLNNAKEIVELGVNLGITSPEFFSWNTKHGNHGLLIFQQKDPDKDSWKKDLLKNVSALLSFCGI